jgi:hypothetical protein
MKKGYNIMEKDIEKDYFWQTRTRGTDEQEYDIYRTFADNGAGFDVTNDLKPLKTFQEWKES